MTMCSLVGCYKHSEGTEQQNFILKMEVIGKGKDIPVTGHEGP
jgi:hypothetical protein